MPRQVRNVDHRMNKSSILKGLFAITSYTIISVDGHEIFLCLLVKENTYGQRGLSLKSKIPFIEQHQTDVEFKVLLHLFLSIYVHLPFSLLEKGTMFEEQSMFFNFYLFFTHNLVPVQNQFNFTVLLGKVMVLHQHSESCRLLSLLAIAPSLLPTPCDCLWINFCSYVTSTTIFFPVSALKFHSQRL